MKRGPYERGPGAERREGPNHWSKRTPEKVIRGEAHRRAKLKDSQVIAMRAAYRRGIGTITLGRILAMNPKTVWEIVTRRKWKHVP